MIDSGPDNELMKPPYRWVILALVFLLAFVSCILIFSYSVLIRDMMLDLRITHAQAGLIFSILVIATIMFRILWGFLCDRIGFKLTIGFGAILMSIFGLLRGFAVGYEMLLALQLLFGIGYAALMPSIPKAISEWFMEDEVGLATGIYTAGYSSGIIITLGITPPLLMLVGTWRGIFHVYGALSLIATAIWWLLSKQSRTRRSRLSVTRITMLEAVKTKEAWLLTGIFLSAVSTHDTLLVWLPYMLELKGVLDVTGFIASMLPLGFLVSGPVIGALSDKMGSRRLFILILGSIIGPGVILIALASDFLLWLSPFILGFCTFGVMTMVFAIPTEHPKMKSFTASILGLVTSVGNIGSFVMPTIVGYIKDVTGTFLPAMITLAVLGGLSFMLGLRLEEYRIRLQEQL